MELIQKFEKWKECDDGFQAFITISSVELEDVVKKAVNIGDLKKRREVYGVCSECNEPGTGSGWCKTCNAKIFEKNFKYWTSGNKDIDELIQISQLNAVHYTKCLEWIPYEKFRDVKYITNGGFSKIFSATWDEGYIIYWDIENHNWKRNPVQVILKNLNNSSENINFLNEVNSHLQIYFSNIIQCYGITQEPVTKNYVLVLKYCKYQSMRNFLNRSENHINCGLKIEHLLHISRGLLCIHNAEKVHRDLHSGNILIDGDISYIGDFGLCQSINYEEQERVYGVLPYVAPEVLREYKYTKAADIYSFGIIMNELISEEAPYNDVPRDQLHLTVDICKGLRPKISEDTPKFLADLIIRCWDAEATNRPTAKELYQILDVWNKEKSKTLSEICLQITNYEKVKRIKSIQTYSQPIYTSKNLKRDDFLKLSKRINSTDTSSLQLSLDAISANPISEELDCYIVGDPNKGTYDNSEVNNKLEDNNTELQSQDQKLSRQIDKFEKSIENEEIPYYDFKDFNNISTIGSGKFASVSSVGLRNTQLKFAIKKFIFLNEVTNEVINEINLTKKVLFHPNIIRFYGITKSHDEATSEMNYWFIYEYAEGGTLRNYLKENFPSLNWQDKYRLALQLSSAIECLHENEIVHNDLHSNSILIQQNSIKLADFGLSKRIKSVNQIALTFDTIPYDDPKGGKKLQDINSSEKNKQILKEKGDIYSVGVLLWELSSGKKPFTDKEYNAILVEEITNGLRESKVEGTPEEYYNLYTRCWDDVPDRRPRIQEVVTALKAMISSLDSEQVKYLSSKLQIIHQFKLNHGLFLDEYSIRPSERAVFFEDGDLDISLYEGQPLVYTFINDRNSQISLLNFKSDNHSIEGLRSSDICINFPVAEITYSADLIANLIDDELYGHLYAGKILVGGKLFIDDFKSATSTQIDSFKFLLTWMYDSAKFSKENPFINLSDLSFFPKIRTLDGDDLNTCAKLTNWMNNLYQNDVVDIISYNNLVPISQLKSNTISLLVDEKQPGITNFKERLSFHDWIGDSIHAKLKKCINEKHLIYGMIINKYFELELSKKVAINFTNIPNINLSDKSFLKIVNPTTSLEDFLVFNNIFSTKGGKNIRFFPFTKMTAEVKNCNGYAHFLVKFEKYKISFDHNKIVPSRGLKQAIENALENMRPFTRLQNVFDEFGHFFPLDVVLGKSLKNILSNSSSYTSEEINLKSTPFKTLNSYLDRLNLSYLLTTKGDVIEKSDLYNWIQNTDDGLEIIEFNNVISLYDILEVEQKRKIDIVLNGQNDLKIIMTGIEELKNLDVNNTEHYKRINIKPSLENENYEVFGSVISKNNLRLEDILITFELYDCNGFSAIIKALNNDTHIDITECYILWIIVGIPSKLSVFSPRNRDLQVYCIKKPITLQVNNSYYPIKTSCQLGDKIFVNVYCSTANYEPINIKIDIDRWSEDCIYFKIVKSNYNGSNFDNSSDSNVISESHNQHDDDTDYSTNIEITICILPSQYENLSIDNRESEKYSLDLIGYSLPENIKVVPFANFLPLISEIGNSFNEIVKLAQAAEHNIRTCAVLLQRVYAAVLAVLDQRNREEFFNNKNYLNLQNLANVISKIKKFISDISQMKSLIKYIQAKSIEKTFEELCKEYDSCVNALSFSINIKTVDELGQLKVDQDGLVKYLEGMNAGAKKNDVDKTDVKDVGDDVKEIKALIANLSKDFSSTVVKVNAMNNTMEKFMNEPSLNQSKIDNIFRTCTLKLADYEQDNNVKPRRNLTKWVSIRNKGEELAFKSISDKEDQRIIQNQVTILKELHGCNNIIKFYGLASDDNKQYLVTEWAEYGNLREFYVKYKDRFNLRLKLQMSIDIARGLNFLRSVEILHRDIRAENVIITLNETAKLASFKLSRSLNAVTLKQDQNLERARYCAPELLERNSNIKYDYKCEVYSFGILLWEIAEEKIPYKNYKDIIEIVNLVSEKYRESFSENSQMPEKFKNLALNAVNHDPESRPKITEMLKVLDICFEEYNSKALQNQKLSIKIEDNEPKSKLSNVLNAESVTAPALIPFVKFLPIISEIGLILDEIVTIVEVAEHNKRTCKLLRDRGYAAESAVRDLKFNREGRKEFFNKNNYLCLQNLSNIMKQIKKFILEISQMRTLAKYIKSKDIEKTFKELSDEFDSCVSLLSSSINIKNTDELEQIREDQKELAEYLEEMNAGIKDDVSNVHVDVKKIGDEVQEIKALIADMSISKDFSTTVVKVSAMNNSMEKLIQNQTKIDDFFRSCSLNLSDYKADDNERPRSKDKSVTKWYNTKIECEEVAFKIISGKYDQIMVQNHITILKELHDWQNILKFYGIINYEGKWHLVTEWAEYGNLREFYTMYKEKFDLKSKLRISLDIARGLNFLRAVDIVHHDIRAENILITLNETAKLANFNFSRHAYAATSNLRQNLDRVRYCAPELLIRTSGTKYDQRCEVYSFGILLWEIAEERTPYEGNDDIMDITERVRNKKYREPFSEDSKMPPKFIRLVEEAVHDDPYERPKITKMFEVLRDCVKVNLKKPSLLQDLSSSNSKHSTSKFIPKRAFSIDQDSSYSIPTNLPDFESFNYMTLTKAAKQHKLFKGGKPVGDTKTAYKCFEAYANLGVKNRANRNQIIAKYYKAYYISKGLAPTNPPDKDIIVAELFKEVADDEANEFPEAKVRYGDCLYNGKGVEQNFSEALKYFEKAAEDGLKVAMYNAGNLYYKGIGCTKDIEKAKYYMKLAVYNDYEPAIKFCEKHNL
ncbi:hypothetical protein RclHR1_00560009 [Rhizophagus clarus]|uniref:Kinase-like domain-containing protein n=1 Tax=Rhizophagus clarus TaxID=94130 RepID=A0A2Z6S6J4_9GLOM|nr:hypothetical protein RclHR1_00560009 [Rhizophagus clarus]GES99721.1 kinase-like domain-containing protein [Rhizophagus clarus]